MYYIIDRFEETYAVLEDAEGKIYNVPKELLPDCREGDRIIIKKDDKYTGFKNNVKIKNIFID